MEYKLLGSIKDKKIYFPIEDNKKILILNGKSGSGKTMMLRILNEYYNKHNISTILITPYQPLSIPRNQLESTICLFKLWNRNYIVDSEYFKYVVENYDKEINTIPDEYKKIFIILNIFYLTTINKYSIILVDDIYSKYFMDISYLLGYTDVRFIFSADIDLINSSNIIYVKQCIRDN